MNQPIYVDYLEDIVNAIERAESFVSGLSFEQFQSDDKTIFACIRALEIIGEAANKIPKSLQQKYPSVPWKEMIGMRNKLIHDYSGVNDEVIWKTIKNDLPNLKSEVTAILDIRDND